MNLLILWRLHVTDLQQAYSLHRCPHMHAHTQTWNRVTGSLVATVTRYMTRFLVMCNVIDFIQAEAVTCDKCLRHYFLAVFKSIDRYKLITS